MPYQQAPDFSEDMQQNQSPEVPARRVGLRTVILCLVLLLAGLVIVHETLLQITTITVVGNTHVSRHEILDLAGLNGRVSYLSIKEKDIAAGIDSHVRLSFEALEKQFPNKLTLYVHERIPCANVTVIGTQYLTDETGYVLEKCDANMLDNGLICVTGLNVKRMSVGETLVPSSAEQLLSFYDVVAELQLQGCISQFSELNIADVENLYLVTVDGFTVNLGDRSNMRGKLLTVRGVLRHLQENGYEPGGLDATVPGYATYTPPNL